MALTNGQRIINEAFRDQVNAMSPFLAVLTCRQCGAKVSREAPLSVSLIGSELIGSFVNAPPFTVADLPCEHGADAMDLLLDLVPKEAKDE